MKNKISKIILVLLASTLLCSFNASNPIAFQDYKSALGLSRETLNPVQISQTLNLVYPGARGDLKYDLYYPVDYMKKKYPIFIWIHGGGFWAGDRADAMDVAVAKSIAEMGYIVSSIDYTLAVTGVV